MSGELACFQETRKLRVSCLRDLADISVLRNASRYKRHPKK